MYNTIHAHSVRIADKMNSQQRASAALHLHHQYSNCVILLLIFLYLFCSFHAGVLLSYLNYQLS